MSCRVNEHHWENNYRKISIMRRFLIGNEIVDHSDIAEASPVSAAPTTSSFPS